MYGGTSNQGWLGLAVFLVICGLVIGLALIGSDLVNPISSWAESQRYQAETQQLAEREAVDIEQHKQLREAETQAEILRLNGELAQQEQRHQAELQRLSEEMQYEKQIHQEEIRQAQEITALKLRLINAGGYIFVSSIGVSLVILSFGASRRLWRNPPPASRWVPANLRPQQPLQDNWRTATREQDPKEGSFTKGGA